MDNLLTLKKRECDIEMRLIPYGGGWTDVYLNICGDSHYFIITNVMGDQFGDLMFALYHLYNNKQDSENAYHNMEYKTVLCEKNKNEYKLISVAEEGYDSDTVYETQEIPWKISFKWDEEGAWSDWTIEREISFCDDFQLKVHIEHFREEIKVYDYEVSYKELCYAVSKACTDMLKNYGFFGYHYSTQYQDMNIRHLLYLKSIALNNYEALKTTPDKEKGHGECTDIKKELELLLFDM